jgi:integrase
MAKRKKNPRLYWRHQGGTRRAYGDFRDFAEVGGRREPLAPPDERLATVDSDIAQVLIVERLKELEARRRGRVLHGITKRATLASFAGEHLIAKAKAGNTTDRWLGQSERYIRRAIDFFGVERDLSSITVSDVRRWVAHLQMQSSGRGKSEKAPEGRPNSGATVRHHLNVLSNLYRRAQGEGYVILGYNPVTALMEKPNGARREAHWLEVHHAALLLEAARTAKLKRPDLSIPFVYPLLGTFLLTGGRKAEVLGLEVNDISFDRKTVTFRVNEHRRLKTCTSARVVPLWPQLEEILRPYVFGGDHPPTQLLFPSSNGAGEQMVTNFDGALDQVAEHAGWKPGEIRSKMFRHTYCSTRLQTLDHGAPISIYTVSRELGHGGDSLVKRVYGHLGAVRHRSEVVEYRVEHFAEQLKERLAALQA